MTSAIAPGDGSAGDPRGRPAAPVVRSPVLPSVRAPAVRWLSPTGLLQTGLVVAQGQIFAKYADKREVMAAVPGHAYDLEPHARDRDYWVDYLADTGDGFDASYTVACSVARAAGVVQPPVDAQPVGGCTCEPDPDHTGGLLVLGGDAVYPVASVRNYSERTTELFDAAVASGTVPPAAYVAAIPGNHDWYDGLVTFRRIFCESWLTTSHPGGFLTSLPPLDNLDTFGAWHAVQERSYFAVRLPHDWWVWGIDIQLDAPIDAAQMDYFRRAREELGVDGRVILCTGRPSWTDAPALDGARELSDRQTLAWFVDRLFDSDQRLMRVRMLLSGDRHHYVRYSPTDPTEQFSPTLVTCGGGGAYLSSTHHLSDELHPFRFAQQRSLTLTPSTYVSTASGTGDTRYPSRRRSQQLRNGCWRIPVRNDGLPVLVAGVYALLIWTLAIGAGRSGWPHLGRLEVDPVQDASWASIGAYVPFLVVAILVVAGMVGYAGAGRRPRAPRSWMLGVGHALAHLVTAYAVGVLLGWAVRSRWPDDGGLLGVLTGVVVVLGVLAGLLLSGFVGALVYAAYLWICDGLATPMHENELFAGMRIDGYKCHLRLHVTAAELHVRAIGIDEPWRGGDAGPVAAHEIDRFVVTRDPAPVATGRTP